MFVGAESIYERVSEGVGLDEAIEEWNKEVDMCPPDKEEEKDYKARLDGIFMQNGKGYYKKRDEGILVRNSVSK